ncbi:MAG TPA: peptidoglycan DD-metalloendopeptidase family protein [Anaerolineae bacterium]|nr:peptidoglycan DD-metalloendopeptidase family protein [Anaerolineae bacterium]
MKARLFTVFVSVSITLLAFLLPVGGMPATAQGTGVTTRISLASDGTQGNDTSGFFHAADGVPITPDGRFVAFASKASNLVAGDTNGRIDVFVHDLLTEVTERVSISSAGMQGNSDSYQPSISADGHYVAFASISTNLVITDASMNADVFIHDRQTHQTMLVSIAWDGTQPNGDSNSPTISADGRYVAFFSISSNLVRPSKPYPQDVFVRDLWTGRTEMVSVSTEGQYGNSSSGLPAISADGRYIAFESGATNLVSNDTNGVGDVFVRDRVTGVTERVSIASDGMQGNESSEHPSISADGRVVAFRSRASNLVGGDTNNTWDVFVHDRQTHQTIRVSVASDGMQGNGLSTWPSISPDGRYVGFGSLASNLVSGDANNHCGNGTDNCQDVFVHATVAGQTIRVSIASDGTEGNSSSFLPSLSTGARYAAFVSYANNLVPGDTNGASDVFVHDRGGGTPSLQLPFDPSEQTGPCAFSPNSLSCISSLFDHEYPLLPPSLGGTEPTAPGIGDTIMIFNGNEHNTGGTFPNASDYGYSGHDATDFRLSFGSTVIAAAPGTVTVIRNLPGGLVVEIDHGNGYKSAHWHLSTVADGIYTGTEITQADVESKRVIGYSGTAGTGPHLHFAVYLNGRQVDPFGWKRKGSFEDPWVADYGGPESNCLWNFACSVPTWATSTSGASLTSPDGSTTVSVPASAVTDTTLLELTLTPDPVAEPSAIPAGYSFDLSAQDIYGNAVETFLQPLTIVINYAESIVDYVLENTLTLHYWDDATQSWQALATSVDLENNSATATTDHLSLFTLLGEPTNPAPTITSVIPSSGYSHLDTEIAIAGTGFLPTPSIRLGVGQLAVTFIDSTTLTAVVPSGLDSGVYTVRVTNPDAQEGSLESAFTVREEHSTYLPLIMQSARQP